MHIFISTPTYSYRTHVAYTQSLATSVHACMTAGIHVDLNFQTGLSLVIMARNMAVTEFLKSKATDLVFIDDDISWQGSDLVRLVKHQVDLVGVACRMKTPKEVTFNVKPLDGAVRQPNGLIEVERIGTGMIRISRRCIKTLIDKCPHLKYRDSIGVDRFALFNTGLHNGELRGEDSGFCDIWREHGGKVWRDTEIATTHWDGQTPFTGKMPL